MVVLLYYNTILPALVRYIAIQKYAYAVLQYIRLFSETLPNKLLRYIEYETTVQYCYCTVCVYVHCCTSIVPWA